MQYNSFVHGADEAQLDIAFSLLGFSEILS